MNVVDCTFDNCPPWTFEGRVLETKVLSVYDGDTVHIAVPIDGKHYRIRARVDSIDTLEMRPPKDAPNRAATIKSALMARNRLVQLTSDVAIPLDSTETDDSLTRRLAKNKKLVKVRLGAFDKFGRVLVEFLDVPVTATLLSERLAYAYAGGTKKDFVA